MVVNIFEFIFYLVTWQIVVLVFDFWKVQNPLNPKYNGMVQGLHHIWHTEGIRGFFKGNGTNCARIVPNSAVKFYSYEQASR